jgi:hypothetical protein
MACSYSIGLESRKVDKLAIARRIKTSFRASFICRSFNGRDDRQTIQSKNDYFHSDREELEVRNFIQTILEDERVEIPLAATIDIGVIRERGWAIVEQNAVWGAGLYGCDPIRVLEVLPHAMRSFRWQ